MNPPHSHRFITASLVALIATWPLHADWKDDTGYTRLQQTYTSGVPAFPADGVTQAEAPDSSGNYAPDTANPLFTGFSLSGVSSSSH